MAFDPVAHLSHIRTVTEMVAAFKDEDTCRRCHGRRREPHREGEPGNSTRRENFPFINETKPDPR